MATDYGMGINLSGKGTASMTGDREYQRPPEGHDDSAEWETPVRGRPRQVDAVFSVRLNRAVAEELRAAARAAGMSTSAYARQLIETGLAKGSAPEAQPADTNEISVSTIRGTAAFYGGWSVATGTEAGGEVIPDEDERLIGVGR